MRSYVAIAIVAVLAFYYESVECAEKMDLDGLRNMLKPMSKSCKKKTGVPDEVVANTHKGEFPRDRKLMCYFKCLSVLLKLMDKEGNVNLQAAEKNMEMMIIDTLIPRIKTIGYECYDEVPKSSDPCEYAFDFTVCGYNKDKSLYVLP